MIVGMAPGAQEDVRGRPFVGPSGDILNDALAQAGLSRDQVYITNAVKCFPGKGKPDRKNITICTELYLKEEILRVKPDLIIAMGDLAMMALTNRSGVKENRGQTMTLRTGLGGSTPVLVTYHPAAYLHSRDPKIPDAIRADLSAARDMLNGSSASLPIREEASLLNEPTLAVDVETDATGRLIVGTLATADGRYMSFTSETAPSLFGMLGATRLVAWNAAFDVQVLQSVGVDTARFEIGDPMLMLHLLDSARQGRYGLEPAVLDELGWADRTWLNAKAVVHGEGALALPFSELTQYCAKDSVYTARLYERFKAKLLRYPKLVALYKYLTLPAALILPRVERLPIPLDRSYLLRLDDELTVVLRELEEDLRRLAGLDETPNFRSTHVLVNVLFERLGLPVVAVTEKGAPSTNKVALMELANLSPFAGLLLRHRYYSKLRSSYVRRWLKRSETTPLRFRLNLLGTETGRLSGDGQQTPRVPEDPDQPNIRNAVVAPPGFEVVEADYSMLELRLYAWHAPEPTMLRLLRGGLDIHAHTAAQVFPGQVLTPFHRTVGKLMNFGLGYGAAPPKLAEIFRTRMTDEQIAALCDALGVDSLLDAARTLWRAWHNAYPGVKEWHWKEQSRIIAAGAAVAPHGRLRWLPTATSRNETLRSEAVREGINHVIQSLASDLMLMALVLAEPLVHELGVIGLWPVHDSVTGFVPEQHVERYARSLTQIMEEEAPRAFRERFGVDLSVPIVADIKSGPRWGSVRKLTKPDRI